MNELLVPLLGKLLEFGLPGLIIAYLIYKNRVLENDLEKKDQFIRELFEKRHIESIDNVKTLGRNETSNDKLASALQLLADKINRNYEMLDRLDRERK